MCRISQHKSNFEHIYKKLPGMEREWHFQFPLEEIEGFDWHRGKWANEYYHYFYRRFSSHILSRLSLEDGQKILVVGCGFGFDEKNIKSLNKTIELWSIDISEEMIKRAIENHSPSRFFIGAAEKLPFPSHCFDRVLAREVIEHVLEPKAMLQEIGRVLKEGGKAVITTENHRSFAPSHRYDGFIKPKMAKIFDVALPRSPYKNEAPAMDRTQSEAKAAGLRMVEFFRDGALYKFLPEWAPLFKTSLPRIAHFFSCLENHPTLARVFCDQVKYIFLKEDHPSQAPVPSHEVFLTCPVCKERLHLYPGFYACMDCHRKYYLTGDTPNFLPKQMGEPVDPILPSERQEDKTSLTAKGSETKFKALNLMCRTLYGFIYIGLALLATLVAEKNDPYLSGILSKEDTFQQYIKIYPRK